MHVFRLVVQPSGSVLGQVDRIHIGHTVRGWGGVKERVLSTQVAVTHHTGVDGSNITQGDRGGPDQVHQCRITGLK